MMSAGDVGALLGRLGPLAEKAFKGVGAVTPTGYTPLYVNLVDYIMVSHTRAFYIALGLIFFLMLAWLRSLRFALIALAANALPVGIMLAAMAAMNFQLDVASATIAAIVLGVAIDDTIHFMHRFCTGLSASGSVEAAITGAFEQSGRAMVVTSAVIQELVSTTTLGAD